MLLQLIAKYYELVAQVHYGAKYLANNEATPDGFARYQSLINNIGVLHKKIKEEKSNLGLLMYNFNNVKKEHLHVVDGFLVGNIIKGKEEAYTFVSEFDHNKELTSEELEKYELGLFVLNLSSKVKETYIRPKEYQEEVELKEEDKPDNKENEVKKVERESEVKAKKKNDNQLSFLAI